MSRNNSNKKEEIKTKTDIFQTLGLTTIQIPEFLYANKDYKNLSGDAKVIYSFMLQKMEIVEENNWFDENGYAYIQFPRSEIQECLGCTTDTATRIYKALQNAGLIMVVRIPPKVSRIYIQDIFH